MDMSPTRPRGKSKAAPPKGHIYIICNMERKIFSSQMRGLARLDIHLAQPHWSSMLCLTDQMTVMSMTGKFNTKFHFNTGHENSGKFISHSALLG